MSIYELNRGTVRLKRRRQSAADRLAVGGAVVAVLLYVLFWIAVGVLGLIVLARLAF